MKSTTKKKKPDDIAGEEAEKLARASVIFDGILGFRLSENRFWADVASEAWGFSWDIEEQRLRYRAKLNFRQDEGLKNYNDFMLKPKPKNMADVLLAAEHFRSQHWAWIYAVQNKSVYGMMEMINNPAYKLPLYFHQRLVRRIVRLFDEERPEMRERQKHMVSKILFVRPMDERFVRTVMKKFELNVYKEVFFLFLHKKDDTGLDVYLKHANIKALSHKYLAHALQWRTYEEPINFENLRKIAPHCNLKKNASLVLNIACDHPQKDILIPLLAPFAYPAETLYKALNDKDRVRLAPLIPYVGENAWRKIKKDPVYRNTPEAQKRILDDAILKKRSQFASPQFHRM